MKKSTYKLFAEISNRGVITESEINTLIRRLNKGEERFCIDEPVRVTPEQAEKGRKWILNKFLKKDGTPRKGFENFEAFIECIQDQTEPIYFFDYYDAGKCVPFYYPVYLIHDKKHACTYSYYVVGGNIYWY